MAIGDSLVNVICGEDAPKEGPNAYDDTRRFQALRDVHWRDL
jgi:hypothetical protein